MYNLNILLLIFVTMEHEIIKIPMPDSIFDELEDAYIDNEKETSHDFVWGLIRGLCRDAKLGKLNKTCTVNTIKNGATVQDQIKLRGFELQEAESNPEWIPEKLERDEIKYFEHKVTDKTMEYLKLFCSFAILRHTKYSDALQEDNERKLAQMIENKATDAQIKDAKENFDQTITKFRDATPKYLQEILYNAVYPQIHRKVTENVDKEFDKENEEMYPKKEAVKKTA